MAISIVKKPVTYNKKKITVKYLPLDKKSQFRLINCTRPKQILTVETDARKTRGFVAHDNSGTGANGKEIWKILVHWPHEMFATSNRNLLSSGKRPSTTSGVWTAKD